MGRLARILGRAAVVAMFHLPALAAVATGLPSVACGSLLCGETCMNDSSPRSCADFSTKFCPTDQGCAVVSSCNCKRACPNASDCQKRDQTSCESDPQCAWQPSCAGTIASVNCLDIDDEGDCKAKASCHWERNCN